jgi:hypothetical protein
MIKILINTLKAWNIIRKYPTIFKVVEDIFKFVETVHKEQKPMVTKIVLLNMADGTEISDFVSLWAGIGEASPIERCSHLKAQNIELKRLLILASSVELSTDDKQMIEITLKYFE